MVQRVEGGKRAPSGRLCRLQVDDRSKEKKPQRVEKALSFQKSIASRVFITGIRI